LSNLFDFDAARDAVPVEKMNLLDRWALHQAAALINDCTKAYEAYEFHRVYQLCNQFCSVTLSATYHDILKDRLYTLGTNSPLRRSSQTAIHHIFDALVRVLAPILTFTTDEAWAYATAKTEYAADSIHLQDWPAAPGEWTNAELAGVMAARLQDRAKVNEAIEPLRAAGKIGKSLDVAITLPKQADENAQARASAEAEFLAELFIVSQVQVSATDVEIQVRPCAELGFHRCPRCWRWVPALEKSALGDVCPRCVEALRS
jgi:isoleucyl-tRNA synthetase